MYKAWKKIRKCHYDYQSFPPPSTVNECCKTAIVTSVEGPFFGFEFNSTYVCVPKLTRRLVKPSIFDQDFVECRLNPLDFRLRPKDFV